MKLFLSAGEPSGDVHAANLLKALKARDPATQAVGFGGDKLRAVGCDLVYPLCDHAVMGLTGALAAVPRLWGVYQLFQETLRKERPDAVVLVDYPGFHWYLAHRAKRMGIPVIYFVPPQIWAWATHRVRRMQRHVDHVLCSLPFEESWYANRGVRAHYIGHPFFDEVNDHRLDGEWCQQQRQAGGRVVALLPGSRNKEVKRNGPTLARVARRLVTRFPDVRCHFACFKPLHAEWIADALDGPLPNIEVHVGKTPEIMSLAHCAAAVSGSVSLELLHHQVPTVISYRIGAVLLALVQRYKRVPFITLVNLLAKRELFPEFLTCRDESNGIFAHLEKWLTDEPARQNLRAELRRLASEIGQPGACGRAADYLLNLQPQQHRVAA